MKAKLLKILIAVIVPLVIVTLLFLSFYKFPKKMDLVVPAVMFYENDPSSSKQTSIKIEGTLNQPLFKQHVFEGSIIIDDLALTYENNTLNTYVLDKKNGINSGNLVYRETTTPMDFVAGSMIWFDDAFEHINIVSRWGQDEKLTYFIVSGSSYEEAINTQNRMRDKYGAYGFVPREE